MEVANLHEQVRGRPIALVLPGHSVEEFENRIQEFKDFDWCWGTINHPKPVERLLSRIGKKLEVVISYSNRELHYDMKWYEDFQWKGVIVTASSLMERYFRSGGRLGHHSPVLFIRMCVEKHFPKIYLFGADGYSQKEGKPYYKDWREQTLRGLPEQSGRTEEEQRTHHKVDCVTAINDFFKDYDFKDTEVINVSPNSHYACFKKMPYGEFIKGVNTGV